MAEELHRIGYLGPRTASYIDNPLSAHFELHIEQHTRLQDAGKKIGIVTLVQGVRWYRVDILGRRAHAGSTPMTNRADALVAAAKITTFLEAQALKISAVATVGVLDLEQPSSNTVPGSASLTIDIRHQSEAVLEELEASIRGYITQLTTENDMLQHNVEKIWHSPAVELHPLAVYCARSAAAKVAGNHETMDLISFAGHDSALTATKVPTAMIFVPSKDGISHAPEEFTSQDEW